MNAGRIAVLGYVLAYLVIPMIGVSVLGRPDYSSYHYSGLTLWGVVGVATILIACMTPLFSLERLLPMRPDGHRGAKALYHTLQKFILPVAIVVLALTFILFPPALANYRYLDSGISGLGAGFFIAVALKSVAIALLVWLLAEYIREPERREWDRRLAVLLLASALVYSASGTGDIFAASFFLLLFLSPRWFVWFTTIDRGTSLLAGRNLYKYLGIAIIAAQAVASISVGENIKDGVGTVAQSISSSVGNVTTAVVETISTAPSVEPGTPQEEPAPVTDAVASAGNWFVMRMLEGMASHYYSYMQFFDGFAQQRLTDFAAPLSYPINAVHYRIGVLTGDHDMVRPDIQSISRLNFVVLSLRSSPMEGTSPGAVASFAYILPLPLAIAAAILYLALVSALLSQLFYSAHRQISLVGGLVIMIQLQVLFQSPLDFILIIDNAFVFLLALIVLSLVTGSAHATQPEPEIAMEPVR